MTSQGKTSANFSASTFKKSGDGVQYKQLLDVFDGLMKKSIKEVRNFELEARDRQVIVDLPEIDGEDLDDDTLK